MKKKAPPRIVIGGGAPDEFGEPIDIAEFLVREFEHAHDMRREAQAELTEVETLATLARGLGEPDATQVADRARQLLAQAKQKLAVADAVRKKFVANITTLAGGAEWREQGVQARSKVRRKQGDVSRLKLREAVRAAQVAGLEVTPEKLTPDFIRPHWPGSACPSDRYLHTLIREWRTEQSK